MRILACALAAFAFAACSPKPVPADVILLNGDVWTGVEGAGRASAVAIADGRILYVGDRKGAHRHHGAETEIIDLGGQFVSPGFIDAHTHFLVGGRLLAGVQLAGAKTREEFTQRIADYAAAHPNEWVLDGNWDHEAWGGELPTRDWIDAATGATPVFVGRTDGHMALANSEALRLAGIDETTPTPSGGEIVRDSSGRPTGVLKDEAMQLVERVIPPPTEEQSLAAFSRAQDYALSNGVTQIHDMAMSTAPGLGQIEIYRKARANGLMKIRISAFSPISSWKELAAYVETNGEGDDMLRWNSVKGFVDGALGSATAWFYEPFTDQPENSGFALVDTEKLKSDIRDADAAGLHVAVHAIGDRANDWLLDTFSEIGGETVLDRRFRVEHAQHLTRGEIDKFASLGVIASMQSYHAIDDGRWAERRIGPERIKTTYAFRSLLDSGGILSFGSDWTVAPMSVVQGLDAAMFRRTLDGANPGGWVPEEKITAEEALQSYTVTNAYAGFQEDRLGTLEAGKLADKTVLSADPTKADETTIAGIKVMRTIVGGESVFIREE